jgi:hypothetical protein
MIRQEALVLFPVAARDRLEPIPKLPKVGSQ